MGLKVTGLSHAYTANLITGEQQKISPIAAHEFLKQIQVLHSVEISHVFIS